jgi:hypothetical protein
MRVPGVSFSAADVANLAFTYQAINVGADVDWERGAGTTDGSGAVTISSHEASSPAGPLPPPAFDTFQIDGNGLVSMAQDATVHGFMTADKKAIFVVTGEAGPSPVYTFRVAIVSGQSFVQGDLAGVYGWHMLTSGATVAQSSWGHGELTIDAAGNATFQSAVSPGGSTTPAGFTLQISSSGAVSRADVPSYAGQMAYGKDFYVRTQSSPNSLSLLAR